MFRSGLPPGLAQFRGSASDGRQRCTAYTKILEIYCIGKYIQYVYIAHLTVMEQECTYTEILFTEVKLLQRVNNLGRNVEKDLVRDLGREDN